MNKIIKLGLLGFLSMFSLGNLEAKTSTLTDVYDLKMYVKIPRIYNNSTSKGYRKYQKQKITGKMYISYFLDNDTVEIHFSKLQNETQKNITYTVYTGYDYTGVFNRFGYVGDNSTEKFRTAFIKVGILADPSYNIGKIDEDNTLVITLSGVANCFKYSTYYLPKSFSGTVTGDLGCGCMAYGHKSPTRTAGAYGATKTVTDVATVNGTFAAKYSKKLSRCTILLK